MASRNGRRPLTAAALVVLALVASGCGSDSTGAGSTASDASARRAAWTRLELTDVAGTSFSVSGLAGKPVFVENFATWCSNCLRQLGDTQKAAAREGDSAVFLALSVETDLAAADVADYAKEHGFDDIRFAIMTPEFLAATRDAFGTSSLIPPSTPKVVVGASGGAGDVVTGFETPEEILNRIDKSAG